MLGGFIEPVKGYARNNLQIIERIFLGQLADEDNRVIFIWGWNGVGASAILKNVAQQLESNHDPRLHFDKVIWVRLPTQQSPRLVQRMIAEALGLHYSTMSKFDEHDENDDFTGVTSDERGIVPEISKVIYRSLRDKSFLLLVRNLGITIDMNDLGIPAMTRWTGGKMLFTIQLQDGRTNTSVADSMAPQLSLSTAPPWFVVRVEEFFLQAATEVADYINNISSISGRRSTLTAGEVLECFWYTILVQSSLLNYNDQIIHMSSFLVLDGLIEEGDRGKEMAEAVSQELQCQFMGPGVREWAENEMIKTSWRDRRWNEEWLHPHQSLLLMPEWDGNAENWEHRRWISVKLKHGDEIQEPPSNCSELSTLFLVECSPSTSILPARLFEYMRKLRVLVLKDTNILFLPPSLLCLHELRLLLLVGCKQLKTLSIPTNTTTAGYSSSSSVPQPQLQKLQVLIISQSNNLQEIPRETLELMPNLEVLKLRDTNLQSIPDEPFEHMQRLEVLDLSNNHQIESLPKGLLKAVSLKKLILGGCKSLKTLVPQSKHLLASMEEETDLMNCMSLQEVDGPLPFLHNLETFRHSGSQITKISLRGCCRLKDVELSDLDQLEELDLSGTSIESLDPRVVNLPRLRRLVLLGCANLRRVPWDNFQRFPKEFNLDQLRKVSDNNYYITLLQQEQIRVQMFVRDARLFRQLTRLSNILMKNNVKFRICFSLSIEESKHKGNSRGQKATTATTGGFSREPFPYRDDHKVIEKSFQSHPPPPPLDSHVEIIGGTQFPGDIRKLIYCCQSLHVHDDKSTRSLTDFAYYVEHLRQCRIERCQNMDAMFINPHPDSYHVSFERLDSIWASDLRRLTAVCSAERYQPDSFSSLKHVYLEFCPRLKYIFPSYLDLENLETLHISFCNDLKDVFLEQRETEATDRLPNTLHLSRLRSIHLIELPQLECISKKVYPTALQELKLRGCWSLRRLPFFIPPSTTRKKPEVSCEKDWWDRLEWDGVEANHHSNLFRPHHAAHYKRPTKKTIL